jgi:UDP-GlcNAc:undecaprenyl-phosphate/decaprenyl-phosphate GlcNAc-1-phosphate transferase
MMLGVLTFTIALLVSATAIVPVRQFALRMGMVDRPGVRKIHLQPIPLLGGVAIYFGVLLSMVLVRSFGEVAFTQVLAILAGATLVLFVGTLDDRGLLHHQLKLMVAMPAAALILLSSGIRAEVFSVFAEGWKANLADAALTVFWVTGVTASFSILDHMDGLCAGITAVASLFFATFAVMNGQLLVSTLGAAVMGAAIGFLWWNFNPAKIFMGDGGAMLLGFLMATLALKLRTTGASHAANWLVPIFILGAPIFDTAMVSISRARRGFLPFATPGKDHTAHRLASWGMGTRRVVLSMYGLGFACGLFALLLRHQSSAMVATFATAAAALALVAVAVLEKAPYERQRKSDAPAPRH